MTVRTQVSDGPVAVQPFQCLWPVVDESMPFHALVGEAEQAMPDLLRRHRVQRIGRGRWSMRPGADVPGSGGAHTVLMAILPVVPMPRNRDAITGDLDCEAGA